MEVLQLSMFADHVNTPFVLNLEEERVDLTLVEAEPRKPTPKGFGVPDTIRDDPFALLFRGPGDKPLPQRLYPLHHETLGELNIFLVPIGIDEKGRYYEAFFN